jgi:DNA ligase 1
MKYENLVEVYEALDSTTKRLEKTSILANFFSGVNPEILPIIALLSLGKIFPTWSEKELGIGSKLLMKTISSVVGVSVGEVENRIRDTGDVGSAAEELFKRKLQVTLFSSPLTIEKVYNNLTKIADISGNGAQFKKMDILLEILSSAMPKEAKYITRTVINELRVGVGEGTIRDAISEAFNVDKPVVERAYMLTNDIGVLAKVAKEEGEIGLVKLSLKPGKPVKPMLAQLSPNIKSSISEMGCALAETKYDGIRVQIHRNKDEIKIFTRRLENISKAVPEIVEYINECLPSVDFIIEGEIIVSKDGKPISFQYILQRIRRKYDIERMRGVVPLTLYIFDLLYYREPLIDTPFKNRRKILESIVKIKEDKLELSYQIKVTPDHLEKAIELFNLSLKIGHEGIMIKDPNAPYIPGIRGKKMLKFKAERETLDLIVVGGTYGTGKRAHMIGSYLVAAKDDNNDLKTVAYAASGLDDKTLIDLSEKVEDLIIKRMGRHVEIIPSIILEVAFSEIVKSPDYESGYSLRFPVVKRIRDDLSIDDIDTVDRIESIYRSLKTSL